MEQQEPADPRLERQKVIKDIVENKLKAELLELSPLLGGYYGYVYKVRLKKDGEERTIVIKLVSASKEPSFEMEPIDDRVYGGRWSNLKPSYDLLVGARMPVATLFGTGETIQNGLQYSAMELIEGQPIKEAYLQETDAAVAEDLQHKIGELMGRMHQITRPYQGWTEMQKPYPESWKLAFFESLQNRIDRAVQIDPTMKALEAKIRGFIAERERAWTDPKAYVFSHTDGIQAMTKRSEKGWDLAGIIDVEDNSFTDPSFVLAGYELGLKVEDRAIPTSFWEGYKAHTPIDERFEGLKELFQLYYLLVWLVVFHASNRGTATEQAVMIQKLRSSIREIVD